MQRNFARALSLVLKHEGGYVDHPKDPGGATNKGITIATFRRYVKRDGTKDDLRRISDADVARVYQKHYWDKVRGDDLPDGLDYAVFDFAVNSGTGRAPKYIQRVLGVAQDGVIGPATLKAAHNANVEFAIDRLCDDRMAFLRGLSTFSTFGRGWTNRVSGVRIEAHKMAKRWPAAPADAPKPVPAPTPAPAPQPVPTAKHEPKRGLPAIIAIGIALIAAVVAYFTKG
jgi:lysozyme family protein